MDVGLRLSKIVFFDVAPDLSHLNDAERAAIARCVDAADVMTEIYLRQVSAQNSDWMESLRRRSDEEGRDLLRYFLISGGPWDQFNGDEPFLPQVGARPRGAGFYPPDLTEREWREALEAKPEERRSFLSGQTVVERRGQDLVAIPYSVAYRRFLIQAAEHLRAAASLLASGTLKKFLELRADAFLSNQYRASEIAWIDTDGVPFEVTIGPYETYLDRQFGVKTTFEAFIGLPDEQSSAVLRKFVNAVPDFDAILAERFGYAASGSTLPLEVVTEVYRGGDAAFGRQFVAYNLPNEREIQQAKGSKKIFSRTMMEAKFRHLTLPIAERVLPKACLADFTFPNRMLFVLGHELAHGLAAGVHQSATPLNDLSSMIEEAKANSLGVALLKYFVDRGLLTEAELAGAISTEIVQYLQEWRTGYHEAHSAGCLVEYNWLKAHKAVRFDPATNRLDLDTGRIISGMEALGEELLRLEAGGDYGKAKAFVEAWSGATPEIQPVLAELTDLPWEVVAVHQRPAVEELALR